MTSIDEKFNRLNKEGQSAAEAFIDFLLSREKERDTLIEEEQHFSRIPEYELNPSATPSESGMIQPVNTGIILAEERMIEEKDDIIDFADINTRFTQKVQEKDTPQPVRQRKPLDWL